VRDTFERELEAVTAGLIRMISQVREMVLLAGKALIEANPDLAGRVVELDEPVDELELALEKECLALIARHQPVAKDLRFLAAALKSLTDLERIGDQSVHVAVAAARLAQEPPLKRYTDLSRMVQALGTMLERLSSAFVERNAQAARSVLEMDDEVDDLYRQVQRELLTYMIEDPRTIRKATELLVVARALERIGDHIENVAERVIYLATGERVTSQGGVKAN